MQRCALFSAESSRKVMAGASVNGQERELLAEARWLMRQFAGALDDPKLPIVAVSIDNELREIESVRPPAGMQEEAAARHVARKTAAARKRLAEKADDLVEVAKHNPKYSNIEFKCLDDYEKCRRYRGKYDLLCILSYIVCIGRRLIPLVRQS
jgi:hypothetical protein